MRCTVQLGTIQSKQGESGQYEMTYATTTINRFTKRTVSVSNDFSGTCIAALETRHNYRNTNAHHYYTFLSHDPSSTRGSSGAKLPLVFQALGSGPPAVEAPPCEGPL